MLVKEVNKNIGLQFGLSNLSPFLNTDFTIENFNLVRKIPEERGVLHTYVQELIKGALDFKILTYISSCPIIHIWDKM